MTSLGIHFPNRHLESSELSRIVAIGCGTYVIYVPFLGDWPYWLQICKDIRAAQSTVQIHLRLEKRGDLSNPTDEANQAATIANHFAGFVDSWTWRNEPNNREEAPLSLTAATWQTWLTTFLSNARLLSTVPVAAPPISPGSRDAAGFLSATVNAARAAGVTRRHIHFYGSPDVAQGDMQRERNASPTDDLIGTEYNFGAGNTYDLNRYVGEIPEVCRRAAALRIKTVGVFIWQWFTPPPIPTTVNIRDTIVESAMKTMQKNYSELSPPGGAMFTITEAQFVRLCADVYAKARNGLGVPYNRQSAFTKYFEAQWRAGRYLGQPEANEFLFEDTGILMQRFAGANLWAKNTDSIVHEGLPPFS